MSRPWRTVYNSQNKRVLIRPGNPRPASTAPSATPSESGDVWGWIVILLEVVVAVFALLVVIEIIITCWPFILAALVIYAFVAFSRN